jgi:malate permease and related proteins
MALFPDATWKGVHFVYALGVEVVLWTVGIWLVNPKASGAARNALNPIVLSIVGGLFLNALPLHAWFSSELPMGVNIIVRTAQMLGECAVPLGLLVAGTTLYDLMRAGSWLGDGRAAMGGIVMRMIVLPAMMLGCVKLVPASLELKHVVAIQSAMPAAIFPMIVARRYGGCEGTAMRVILATTILSLFTIPFVVKWTLSFCE